MNRKVTGIVIVSILLSGAFFSFVKSGDEIKSMEVMLKAGDYKIYSEDNYAQIIMKGYGYVLSPGYPQLPSKTFLFALPPGGKVISIDVISISSENISGEYKIKPSPPFSNGVKYVGDDDTDIYKSKSPYPSKPYEYLGMGQLRKYRFAMIRFYPFSYIPAEEKLVFHSSIKFKINYKIGDISYELLADDVMEDFASTIIDNYKDIHYLYEVGEGPNQEKYDYVIITTDSLKNSVEPLKKWRENLGCSVKVVTVSWIYSNYDGEDNPEKIRNFLVDKYAEWGIKYVLIVGSTSRVPMRNCYPSASEKTPTDYYYADLTGNWDSNGDGKYGEYGSDAIDLYPEVYVGRIPVDDALTVEKICEKTINYERSREGWKYKAMLIGAISNFAREKTGWGKTDGASLMEALKPILSGKNYEFFRMYEKEGISPSSYSCEDSLTHENVLKYLPDGYGILNWWAHGSATDAWRKVWSHDDGDFIPEDSEIDWKIFIQSSDKSKLNDEKPCIVFSCACNNAYPENGNNLGKSMMEHGAVVFVGATRTSWYTVGWKNPKDGGNAAIDYYFFKNLIKENKDCGEALFASKIYYHNNFFWWGWKSSQNMYVFCLYGDPALKTELENYPPDPPSNPYPSDGAFNVDNNITLRWESRDPEGKNVVYDVYLGTTEDLNEKNLIVTGLQENSFNVSLEKNTHYFWKIVAKDEEGLKSEGETWDFYTIDTQPPEVNIMAPQPGYIYLFGKEYKGIFKNLSIVIGKITVNVDAHDNFGVEKVEFYVDDALKFTDDSAPYYWVWDETVFMSHTLKIIAYGISGDKTIETVKTWIVNL